MKPRPPRPLPPPQAALLARAQVLSWWSVAMLLVTATLMYVVMGNSQAMKTAWAEDMLSLVPPVAFLVAARFARKPPDDNYVNGRQRAFDIAFLISAVALTGVGIWLVIDGLSALLTREHPTIAGIEAFGAYFWQGWLMIAALALATVPPMLLGRMKMQLARQLHLKSLHADADMNKADWMTAIAGILGIVGIGFGWWWADAVAALLISADILHDGVRNLRHSIRDLHDAWPQTIDRGGHDPQVERIRKTVLALDWVEACELRLHEEGLRLCGVLIVTPQDQRQLAQRLDEARRTAIDSHWRVDEVIATLQGEDDDRDAVDGDASDPKVE